MLREEKMKVNISTSLPFFEIIAYIMVKYRKFSILIKNLFRGCLESRTIRPWNRRTERVLQKYSISASDCPGKKKKERKQPKWVEFLKNAVYKTLN